MLSFSPLNSLFFLFLTPHFFLLLTHSHTYSLSFFLSYSLSLHFFPIALFYILSFFVLHMSPSTLAFFFFSTRHIFPFHHPDTNPAGNDSFLTTLWDLSLPCGATEGGSIEYLYFQRGAGGNVVAVSSPGMCWDCVFVKV